MALFFFEVFKKDIKIEAKNVFLDQNEGKHILDQFLAPKSGKENLILTLPSFFETVALNTDFLLA